MVTNKEVVEIRGSRGPVATDFTRQALGSYLGAAESTQEEKSSVGFSRSNSTYGYLKLVSDYSGRDDGAIYEVAKMVERVSEKLALPRMAMAQAVLIAKRLLPSREKSRKVTLAAVSAYAIIASCKIEGLSSVSTKDVIDAHRELGRRVKASSMIQLSLDSGMKTEARRPSDYVSRVIAKLSLNTKLIDELSSAGVRVPAYFRELHKVATEILARMGEDLRAGRRPCALAATAVYAAELTLAGRESRRRRISQRDVAECGDTAEYTVREQYRRIFNSPAMSKLETRQNPALQPSR
jgi:transcription initiation factor TFIIIB Brf1 subunit/transcription initiation factor TFIIB